MTSVPDAGRGWKRALRACLRFIFQIVRIVFILCLAALPIPVLALMPRPGPRDRRNQPALVVRKGD